MAPCWSKKNCRFFRLDVLVFPLFESKMARIMFGNASRWLAVGTVETKGDTLGRKVGTWSLVSATCWASQFSRSQFSAENLFCMVIKAPGIALGAALFFNPPRATPRREKKQLDQPLESSPTSPIHPSIHLSLSHTILQRLSPLSSLERSLLSSRAL